MKILNHLEVRRVWFGIMLATLTCSLTSFVQTAAPTQQKQADNVYQEGVILWTQKSGEARARIYSDELREMFSPSVMGAHQRSLAQIALGAQ